MAELSDEVHDRIRALAKEGDALADEGKHAAALERYWAAWNLLPAPQTEWDAATWLLGAIGDANFLGKDFAAGRDNLSLAMHCPEAIGNPFLLPKLLAYSRTTARTNASSSVSPERRKNLTA